MTQGICHLVLPVLHHSRDVSSSGLRFDEECLIAEEIGNWNRAKSRWASRKGGIWNVHHLCKGRYRNGERWHRPTRSKNVDRTPDCNLQLLGQASDQPELAWFALGRQCYQARFARPWVSLLFCRLYRTTTDVTMSPCRVWSITLLYFVALGPFVNRSIQPKLSKAINLHWFHLSGRLCPIRVSYLLFA